MTDLYQRDSRGVPRPQFWLADQNNLYDHNRHMERGCLVCRAATTDRLCPDCYVCRACQPGCDECRGITPPPRIPPNKP